MSEPRIVASGAIRVDARRAVAKLREHLLVDLHAYALELLRAATAGGAKRFDVHYDSDDVRFAFDVTSIPVARMPQLLSYVLGQNDELRDQPLRLLALGVNAALGLAPAFVDVYRCDASEIARVRWTPALLARDDAALPVVERTQRPIHAPKHGMLIHVRRKLGKAVLVNAVTGRIPPEIQLLHAHTHEAGVELRLNGKPLRRDGRAPALLRVPFTLPDATRAHVEILPAGSHPSIELHEQGVLLQALAWTPLPGLPASSADGSLAIPARVVIDSRMLATNASRSALREDSDMARALSASAAEAFRVGLAALVRLVTGDGKLARGVKQLDTDRLRLEDALGAIVCVVANTPANAPVLGELGSLLELPLLHFADASRSSLSAVKGARSLYVHADKKGLDPRLLPWFSGVVWLRGRSIERALTGVSLVDAKGLVDVARSGAERRDAHLARPASAPELPAICNELAREKFRFRDGRWAGLAGEVALVVPRAKEEVAARFRFYVEERLLEALVLDPSYVPLSFEAALSWPGWVRPRFSYDAVERDAGMVQAIHAVTQLAIGLANRVAERADQLSPEERTALEPILTRAVLGFAAVPERLGLGQPTGFSRRFPALYRLEAFPTSDGRKVSLADLARYAHDMGALCSVRAVHSPWAAPDGRPVLVARADEARMIAAALGAHVRVVPYERGLEGARASASVRRERLLEALTRARVAQGLPANGPVLDFEQGAALGAMTTGSHAVRIELHGGVRLCERAASKVGPAVITALDDPDLVPTPDWDGALGSTRQTEIEEMRLCDLLTRAVRGDASARADLGSEWDVSSPEISAFLLGLLACLRAISTRTAKEQLAALESVPLCDMLDEMGAPRRVSVADVTRAHATKVPLLDRPPGFATLDWQPVLARTPAERDALVRLFADAFAPTFIDIMTRENRAKDEQARRELMERSPELDPTDLGDLAEHGAHRVEVSDLVTGITVVAALPRSGPSPSPSEGRARVLFQRRELDASVDVPFAAVVNLTRIEDVAGFRYLSADGGARVQAALVDAGSRLLDVVLDAAMGPGNSGRFFGDPRALAIYGWLAARDAALPLEAKMFSESFSWPTVQGEERPSDEFWRLGETWYGTVRYPEWVRRDGATTDLDRPVAYLPPGPSQRFLLAAFGHRTLKMRDVSAELASLQKQRGTPQAPPVLTGMPLHAALRTSLSRLGVTLGSGEIELTAGPGSELYLQLLEGQSTVSAPNLACPVRVVIRIESLDAAGASSSVISSIEDAIEKLLVELLPSLDALPAFVRENARKFAFSRLKRAKSPLVRAPLFVDTTGTRLSLHDMLQRTHEPWAFTTLQPPFPGVKRRCVLMSKEEAKQLKPFAELRLADPALLRARESLVRRSAPALAYIGLTDAERAQCVVTTKIVTETLSGEVGVLSPHAKDSRGIAVHVTRRPLCRLDDQPGPPLIAAVNDDSVKPDRTFTRIAHVKRAGRLADEVREHARRALEAAFRAPSDAVGSEWIEAQSCGNLRVTGRVWIPRDPSRIAPVSIQSSLSPQSVLRPLQVAATRGVKPEVPIEGRLLAVFEGPRPQGATDAMGEAVDRALGALSEHAGLYAGVGELGVRVAARIVAAARLRGPNSPALDEYATHLGLLGAKLPSPPLETTEGRRIAPSDVLVELRRRGAVWASDGEGFVEGEFPSAPPEFILRLDASPAMRALEARLHASVLRRVGSSPAMTQHPEIALSEPVAPDEVAPEAGESPARFWKSLGERVNALFRDQPAVEPPNPILDALLERVNRLELAGDPVKSVEHAPKGRPIRYDRRRQRLLLCPAHPEIVRLSNDPTGLALLAAAAVSEINRALVDVTDADERRALLTLLP